MANPSLVDEWLEADGLILLESWARDGYTIADIANRVGMSERGFRGWMLKYPEIKKAVNNGRELTDYKVENALLKSALGYKTREVHVTAVIKNGRVVEEKKETIDKEFAPNVSACQVWLYNRNPKKWKNMNARNNMLEQLDEDTSIHITVERAGASETQSASGSSTFEEVDTDWQNDVNQQITVRGLSAEEKAQQQKQKGAKPEEKVSDGVDWEAEEKGSSKGKSSRTNSSDVHSATPAKAYTDEDDLDYWPEDWEDEDEAWEG